MLLKGQLTLKLIFDMF